MRKHIGLVLVGCTLALTPGVAMADDASPSPSPSASPTASPTPVPVCSATDLTTYQNCAATCDAASSAICSSQGSIDHFVSFLKTSLANCTYPNLSSERQVNGLKQVVDGLKQSGAISFLDVRKLRKQINVCRKALRKPHRHGHGNEHGKGHR